jgi:hypothetical protein
MKHKAEIEGALERSLRAQVNVRRLDSRFDAGVWARIEAEESRSAAPALRASASATPMAARWLYALNILGLGSVAIFLCMFGAQMLAGMDLSAMSPGFSEAALTSFFVNTGTVIATVAAGIAFMLTPLGRRLRAEFG